MFAKVPPRFSKVFLLIAVVSLILLVSCTTAVDSLAISHLAAQQYSVRVVETPRQLPDGAAPPPAPETDVNEAAAQRVEGPRVGETVPFAVHEEDEALLLLMASQEKPASPAPKQAADSSTTEKKVQTPASTDKKKQAGEKPEVSPDTAPESKPEPGPQPAPEPAPEPKPEPAPEPKPAPAPVSYVWGSAKTVHFRTEVEATNTGTETATKVTIRLPMLENSSPYQKTTLTGTNYPIESKSGRIGTFLIGELEPGESKTVVVDYKITIRPVSISSTNETVEKAKIAYDKFAGSGNCHTLAVGFVNHAQSLGLKARVVTGYKRKAGGAITSGSLSGARHSWAEFHVDGLGWVPVDLTHLYFARIPHASHVVETYSANQFLRIGYSGGNVTTQWRNMIM